MFDYTQLATLSAILRHGAFDAAAVELGITQSAVSQRLRALEDRVGQPLVQRGTPCAGTALGQRLARHAEEVGLMESRLAATAGLDRAGPRRVRIAVNADSLAAWILPALADAQAAAPDLLFDLIVDDESHSASWLRAGEVTAAVTSTEAPPTGCDSHPLGQLRYIAVASPDWVDRHCPAGVTGDALRRAPCMTFDPKDRLQMRWLDREFGPGKPPPTHFLPSPRAFHDGALLGLGWGMNPEPLIRDDLAAGRLVPLRPDRPLDQALYWQVSRRMAPAIAVLTQSVRKTARLHLH